MKKLKIILTTIVILFIFLGVSNVLAVDLGSGLVKNAADKAGYEAATGTSLAENIGKVVRAALSLVGVIFTVLMVYSGILWMTAHGEEEQVATARKTITASIIGLVIALSAYSITSFVVPRIMSGGEAELPAENVTCCEVCPVGFFIDSNDCRYIKLGVGLNICSYYCSPSVDPNSEYECEEKVVPITSCGEEGIPI